MTWIGENWVVGLTGEAQGRAMQREREGERINSTKDVWKTTGKYTIGSLDSDLKEQRTTSH